MKRAIYWFRNNLRLTDNPSLQRAMETCDVLIPVYVLPAPEGRCHMIGLNEFSPHRLRFLSESLQSLRDAVSAAGSDLHVLQGHPVPAIRRIAEAYACDTVYTCAETPWIEQQDERAIAAELELRMRWDQLLVRPEDLPFTLYKLPKVFGGFRRGIEKEYNIRRPLPRIEYLPGVDRRMEDDCPVPEIDAPFDERSAHPFTGGEDPAWERLRYYFDETQKLKNYKKTRNGLIGTDYSTKFSAYLALGCISPVSVYHEVRRFEREIESNRSTYWVIFELLWREFFKYTSLRYGRKFFRAGGIQDKSISWKRDDTMFRRWCEGRTGDDFVDTNMKELKATGWMSNRGRQNVASYLAHDLGLDWRRGADYFESQLVDYDCDSNWGNWMYVAGVGNDPRNRKFNTRSQAERYDGAGRYRKLWNGLF